MPGAGPTLSTVDRIKRSLVGLRMPRALECLDAVLHHAVVVQIEGASYRLRQHAELVPEHVRSKALIQPPPALPPRRRGRPPKIRGAVDQHAG